MDYFRRFNPLSGANQDQQANKSGQNVRLILNRLKGSTPYEAKLDAVETLVTLSGEVENRKQFGLEGLTILMDVLSSERQNAEITQKILETLTNLTETEGDNTYKDYLIEGTGYVPLLLSLLEETDFFIRYHTIQLVTRLLAHNNERVQQNILSEPVGVARLVDMLKETRDVIRNEGLLLLNTLTKNNEDIQKIVTFDEALERLFSVIINEEGGNEGGIIVQDCLEIVSNLVSTNEPNQKYFRETGTMRNLYYLLQLDSAQQRRGSDLATEEGAAGKPILKSDRQKSIIIATLNIIRSLVSNPNTPNTAATKKAFCDWKIIESLIKLALSDLPDDLTIVALQTLGEVVHLHRKSQEIFEGFFFDVPTSAGAIQSALVRLCSLIFSDKDQKLRKAATETLQNFLEDNNDGQLFIASTVKPLANINEAGMHCGAVIAHAMLEFQNQPNGLISFQASEIFAYILSKNDRCKNLLLEIPYEFQSVARPAPGSTFFTSVIKGAMHSIRAKADHFVTIGLLKVLCWWINGCPAAAKQFMANMSNFVYFVELVTSSEHAEFNVHIQGLSAILVGLLCLEFEDDTTGQQGIAFTKQSILDVILRRIGLDRFGERWDALRKSKAFLKCEKQLPLKETPSETNAAEEPNFYDPPFITLLKQSYDRLQKYVVSSYASSAPTSPVPSIGSPDHAANNSNNNNKAGNQQQVGSEVIQKYKELIKQQDREIERLKKANEELVAKVFKFENDPEINQAEATIKRMKAEHAMVLKKVKEAAEAQKADRKKLSDELAETKAALEATRAQLRENEKDFQIRLSMSNDHSNALASQVEKYEKDVESLSQAFNDLEQVVQMKDDEIDKLTALVQDLEAQLKSLQAQNAAPAAATSTTAEGQQEKPVEAATTSIDNEANERRIKELEELVAKLQAENQEKDARIAQLQSDNDDMMALIGEMEQMQ